MRHCRFRGADRSRPCRRSGETAASPAGSPQHPPPAAVRQPVQPANRATRRLARRHRQQRASTDRLTATGHVASSVVLPISRFRQRKCRHPGTAPHAAGHIVAMSTAWQQQKYPVRPYPRDTGFFLPRRPARRCTGRDEDRPLQAAFENRHGARFAQCVVVHAAISPGK